MPAAEKYQPVNCPRCETGFICKPNNIGSCDCNNVTISQKEYEYISSKFSDCVCNTCLNDLKQEFLLTTQSTNTP